MGILASILMRISVIVVYFGASLCNNLSCPDLASNIPRKRIFVDYALEERSLIHSNKFSSAIARPYQQ